MSDVNNGGPAFPLSAHPDHGYGPGASVHEGMSLRDWFAGMVMGGLCVQKDDMMLPEQWVWSDLAQCAYKGADALLAERGKNASDTDKA